MPLAKFSRAKPVRQMVYETLRQAIVEGEFLAGARLLEEDLARTMEVSRTPVREALRKLETEGLIAHAPGKGATVQGFSREDVAELYAIREALEVLAINYTIEHITDGDIEKLKSLAKEARAHLRRRDVKGMFDGSQRFNDLLIQACRMPRLIKIINSYREYRHRFRFDTMVKHKARLVEAWKEHESILEAVIAKDRKKAETLVRQHLRNAKQVYTASAFSRG